MTFVFKSKGPKDLSALPQKLARIQANQLTHSLGLTALRLLTEGFENESDPYGRPWKKPIARQGQTLSDTGQLRNSWRATNTPQTVRLKNATVYAAIHQFGGSIVPKRVKALKFKLGNRWVTSRRVKMPRRPMLPIQSKGLGNTWKKAFRDECQAYLEDCLS